MAVVGIAERGDSDAVGINLQHNRTRLLVTLRSSPQSRLSDAAELDVDSADVQEVAKRKVSLSGSANLIKIINKYGSTKNLLCGKETSTAPDA